MNKWINEKNKHWNSIAAIYKKCQKKKKKSRRSEKEKERNFSYEEALDGNGTKRNCIPPSSWYDSINDWSKQAGHSYIWPHWEWNYLLVLPKIQRSFTITWDSWSRYCSSVSIPETIGVFYQNNLYYILNYNKGPFY